MDLNKTIRYFFQYMFVFLDKSTQIKYESVLNQNSLHDFSPLNAIYANI